MVRTTAPSASNNHYRHTSVGGLNSCILIGSGSVLPNCVGYAWGRAYEELGAASKLSRRNAEDWWGYTADGYQRGKTPRVKSIICWRAGATGNGSDGAGHVAFVEEVYTNGDILTSNSAYGGSRFYTQRVTKASGYSIGGNFVFQGFIYLPVSYLVGETYTLQDYMNVRTGPGTNHSIKQVSELTADGKKHATRSSGNATLKKGTEVTCLEILGNWMRIPSGWVCCKQGSEVYIA